MNLGTALLLNVLMEDLKYERFFLPQFSISILRWIRIFLRCFRFLM